MAFIPATTIEAKALKLLEQYARNQQWEFSLPVPVEQIIETEVGYTIDCLDIGPPQVLGAISPTQQLIISNEKAHYCFRCAKISSQVSPCYCSKQLQDIELAAKIDEQERNVRQAREMLANISQPKATKAVDKAVEAQDKVLVDRDDLVTILDWFHTENMHTKEDYKSMGAVLDRLEAALEGGSGESN